MRPIILAVVALCLVAVVVVGQVPTREPMPASYQDSVASCQFRAIEALEASVDPANSANQEWYRNNAKSYQELGEMGVKCE